MARISTLSGARPHPVAGLREDRRTVELDATASVAEAHRVASEIEAEVRRIPAISDVIVQSDSLASEGSVRRR